MEKTVELLMKNASLLDVELVAGVLKHQSTKRENESRSAASDRHAVLLR